MHGISQPARLLSPSLFQTSSPWMKNIYIKNMYRWHTCVLDTFAKRKKKSYWIMVRDVVDHKSQFDSAPRTHEKNMPNPYFFFLTPVQSVFGRRSTFYFHTSNRSFPNFRCLFISLYFIYVQSSHFIDDILFRHCNRRWIFSCCAYRYARMRV